MPQSFDQFILVAVIDEDSEAPSETSRIVSLPALPRWGDTLVLTDGGVLTGNYTSAVVTDVVIIALEASPTTLRTYVRVFVSFTRTREALLKEALAD
jgi:hypothetical protein